MVNEFLSCHNLQVSTVQDTTIAQLCKVGRLLNQDHWHVHGYYQDIIHVNGILYVCCCSLFCGWMPGCSEARGEKDTRRLDHSAIEHELRSFLCLPNPQYSQIPP